MVTILLWKYSSFDQIWLAQDLIFKERVRGIHPHLLLLCGKKWPDERFSTLSTKSLVTCLRFSSFTSSLWTVYVIKMDERFSTLSTESLVASLRFSSFISSLWTVHVIKMDERFSTLSTESLVTCLRFNSFTSSLWTVHVIRWLRRLLDMVVRQ